MLLRYEHHPVLGTIAGRHPTSTPSLIMQKSRYQKISHEILHLSLLSIFKIIHINGIWITILADTRFWEAKVSKHFVFIDQKGLNKSSNISAKISQCVGCSARSQCDTASLMPRGWCGGQDSTAEGGEGEVEGGWTSHVGPHQDLNSMRCKH